MDSLVRAELRRICERWEEADRRFKEARARAERGELSQAELDRWEAQGDWFGCSRELADLAVLLLRHAVKHHAEALRPLLVEILRPQLDALAVVLLKRLERK